MSTIRLLTNDTPYGKNVADKHVVYVDCIDNEVKMLSPNDLITHITGLTGVVNADKIVQDGSAEGPGNGLPTESANQIYIIKTNTGVGSLDASWGTIDGITDNCIIRRQVDNLKWNVVWSVADGAGQFLIFDKTNNSLFNYDGSGWVRIIASRTQVIDIASIDTALAPGITYKVGAAGSHTVPKAQQYPGEKLWIKSTNAGVGGPSILPLAVGDTIEGLAALVISGNKQAVCLQSDGISDWMIISS